MTIEKELIFEIPECPNNNEVKINKNFRLLCICNYNSISKMSLAFFSSTFILFPSIPNPHLCQLKFKILNKIDLILLFWKIN